MNVTDEMANAAIKEWYKNDSRYDSDAMRAAIEAAMQAAPQVALLVELINALEVARTALCNEGIFLDEVTDVLHKAHGIGV